ncbi:MAG: hypothetical protein U0939_10070 [Pirellulales bacterium]
MRAFASAEGIVREGSRAEGLRWSGGRASELAIRKLRGNDVRSATTNQ